MMRAGLRAAGSGGVDKKVNELSNERRLQMEDEGRRDKRKVGNERVVVGDWCGGVS